MDDRVTVHHGDSRDVLRGIADNTFDGVASDPPYDLESIVARFGSPTAKPATGKGYAGISKRFEGKTWDTGETAFDAAFWAEVLRVTKPGGWCVAFGHETKYDLLAGAMRSAGWEVRGMALWLYGTGKPKTKDVALLVDKAHGHPNRGPDPEGPYVAKSPEGQPWEGWGTALKPCVEPIALCRKPLEGTTAANVQRWGVGGLNVRAGALPTGGFPTNVAHDGSPEVLAMLGDAARLFYCAKADDEDRAWSDHPTVKPVALMAWLVRLIAPRGALILDPFAGTGTTAAGALREGVRSVMIERDASSVADIHRRLKALTGMDTPLFAGL